MGSTSSQSWAYIANAKPICFAWDKQAAERACSLALEKTGKRMAARIAMIAMTTSNSIKVNPLFLLFITILSNTSS
jgi:hypothetical protein